MENRHHPLLLTLAVALILAFLYLNSGTGSLNSNVHELEKASTIEQVQPSADNKVVVKCRNGDTYEIVYQDGQTNYQDLVYNRCGEGG